MASKVVLITGANSGVGYAATKVLVNAPEKFHVIMTGRSLPKVETALAEITTQDMKGSLSAIQLDVTDQTSIQKAVSYVEDKHGHLDVLINNAAVGSRGPDLKTRLEACFATNVVGAALVAEAFRPLLLKGEKPYSIYVSSGAGSLERASSATQSLPYEEAYRASKAALNMIAVIERRDYADQGLNVVTMSPGFVVSNLRGTSEDERSGWGGAGDPLVSGETLLSIMRGERDSDAGALVTKEGTYPW